MVKEKGALVEIKVASNPYGRSNSLNPSPDKCKQRE